MQERQKSKDSRFFEAFVFSAHQREDPEYFVFRRVDPAKILIFKHSDSNREFLTDFKLDPRAIIIFVVNVPGAEKTGYLWRGIII